MFFLLLGVASAFKAQENQDGVLRQDFSLPNPVRCEAFYDVKEGKYYLYPKVGNVVIGVPIVMSFKEYEEYIKFQGLNQYYKEKSTNQDLVNRKDKSDAKKKGLLPTIQLKNKIFETIFGGNKIELIPQGFASFDLAGLYQKIENPLILPQNRKSFSFNIQQRIQLGILAKVGENLQLKANYDTQSGFSFENRMNLVWQAKGTWKDLQTKTTEETNNSGEDRIIKRVEFGNVNMPLSTSLIRGSESLFGLKTEFQLGKTKGTVVLSQQQGEARNVVAQGGGTVNTFKLNAVDYEDNQHYYLGQYFFHHYDDALSNYPQINSKINITRLEVWILDQTNANLQDQKGIIAIRDLGESAISTLPDNTNQNLYDNIKSLGEGLRDVNTAYNTINHKSFTSASGNAEDYVDGEQFIFNRKVRRLNPNEYKFNPQLGYLSLNQRLNDNQLLAVSYAYTVNGSSKVYKVGEFSEESPVLITKLLKPNVSVKTTSPMWNLMMKNIYSLNSNQLSSDGFSLNVFYRDAQNGKVNYLPKTSVQSTNLLKLFNWDRLNQNNDIQDNGASLGDGVFDFVPGITIDSENGKVIFTKAQPFGSYMQNVLGSNEPKYVFNELYTQQKQIATQNALAQRYTIEGRYKSSQSQGISLGAINIPKGSVKVTANGVLLTEGIDYTVDYLLGQVNIINESVKQSGKAVNISLENQLTFNTQRRRFLGLNLEREFNEHLTIGATAVNYSEKPLTQKVQIGQEAVKNTMLGMNLLYSNEFPFLTRMTDKIPFVNTEASSNLNFRAEAAYLIPGQNKDINNQSYIDDFDQTTSKISLKDPAFWSLASRPEKSKNITAFSQGAIDDNVKNGYGRGLISWYNIDPRFYGVGGKLPTGIDANSVSNHSSRRVQMSEIYNNRDFVAGEQIFANTFDITYYPENRGPYNLNQANESAQDRWAGLMRPISVSNFSNSNIEYVEFWMMDPYADGKNIGNDPKLLLHLGNVSEDILKDGKLQYENGLPTPENPAKTTQTNWGTQPSQNPVLYAFSTQGENRVAQDVGFDGLDNIQEATKFGTHFINPVTHLEDPASDDFVHYLSNQFQGVQVSSVQERYKYFRNPEGNSLANTIEVSSQSPDVEDVNGDYNLDQSESYNQYTIGLNKSDLVLGKNFIVDQKEVDVNFQNGQSGKAKWYLFRIPISQFDLDAGDASQSVLNNVRFARLLLTGFDQTSTLRFGTFDLVRSDWRKYTKNLAVSDGTNEGAIAVDNSNFDVGSVNLEENAVGTPPYVIPPGIDRQILSGTTGAQRQNEASLYLKATNLSNSACGVFKNLSLDIRRYQNLELFVHAENLKDVMANGIDENSKFFIRLGSDASDNYYEYESSLKYTPRNAVSPFEIWPNENNIKLSLKDFTDAKTRRDVAGIHLDERYRDLKFGDRNKAIYTKGRPSLGNITTMVIGVRNTSNESKDVVLWVNEIRLSGIENKGGYAANASLNFNLGDLATVDTNASISTIGFGSIEQKPSERRQTDNSSFTVNTTVNMDKFLPEKAHFKIPVTYSYSQSIEDPKYNPINDDVLFKNSVETHYVKDIARTFSQQRSLGILNMHKERGENAKTPKFYDVENLSLTALYNDDYYRDVYTKRMYRQNLKAYLDYNFSFNPWVIKPFDKLIKDDSKGKKYFNWIKEFNINIIPSRFSFRTELDRDYGELEYRNIEALISGNTTSDFNLLRNRNFYFGWQYNLGFNLTKSLKADIFSTTRTLNDDLLIESMNTKSIFQSPFKVGRPILYNHRVQLNYHLPFEYFPYLDFINAEVAYGFQYNWSARSTVFLRNTNGNLGNIAQNANTKSVTASLNIPSLLGKFKVFQKIDSIQQGRNREIEELNLKYEKAYAEKNKNKRKTQFKDYHFKNQLSFGQRLLSVLNSIQQVNLSYTENNGTLLPGILSEPNFFGYNRDFRNGGMGFIFGSQADFRRIVVENHWVTDSEYLNESYTQNNVQNLTASLSLEPIKDLKIDLNLLKTYNRNLVHGGFNVDLDPNKEGVQLSFANEMISFSNTDWLLATSFKDGNDLYQSLRTKAREISLQKGTSVNQTTGFADGYSIVNASVLLPAFRSVLTNKNRTGEALNKAGFPLPNWRITYSGLKNIPIIRSLFSKFDINHAYTSTYTATGVQSNIDYYNNPVGVDVRGDKLNPYVVSQVMYVEEFAPLIGADVTLRNNIELRAQYNRNRMFLLGLVNGTLTEDSLSEYILGMGYILKDLTFKMRFKGKVKTIKSDLNVRVDFSLRDNRTRITNFLIDDSQVTGGQRILGLKISADYNMSENLNFKVFYDQLMTRYKISTAFPLSTVRAGISATFTFAGR